MARFILDVMTEDISKVLEVIERDKFLLSKVTSIRCIDKTCNNQFYSWDSYKDKQGNQVTHTPMMNVLNEEQLKEDRKVLSKY